MTAIPLESKYTKRLTRTNTNTYTHEHTHPHTQIFSIGVYNAYESRENQSRNTLITKNFGQFKFRTSVCPKFQQLITDVMTLMVGRGYKKSTSRM